MRILYVSFLIVIIDQVTKFLIKGLSIPSLGIHLQGIPFRTSINVIPDVLQITYIENPGMAFGMQIGPKLFLSLFTVFATLLIVYFIYRNRKEPFYIRFSLALILGGAIGNLIDRTFYGMIYGYAPIFYGNVVDFIHVNIPDITIFGKNFYTFPIFNVADMAVSIGFLLILFGYNKIFKHPDTIDPEVLAGGGILSPEELTNSTEEKVTELNSNNTDTNPYSNEVIDSIKSDLVDESPKDDLNKI